MCNPHFSRCGLACFGAAPTFSPELYLEPDVTIATGFNFSPLPNGDVLIDFYGDDGVVFNSQIITRECLTRIPVVAHALFLAVEEGKEAALAYMNKMSIVDRINERKSDKQGV